MYTQCYFYVVTYFISLGKKYYFCYFGLKQKILYLNFVICKVWYPLVTFVYI